ncbi:MAG: hypothetical protein Q7S11_03380 [bacterium]|nr:hypothetical protein [bacterium]
MKARLTILCAVSVGIMGTSVCAEEVVEEAKPEALGLEQKLARVYDLYRKNDAVSLKPNEMQVGIGVAYATSSQETFGVRQSTRTFTTQLFASRGIGAGIEVSAAVPYVATSQRAETSDAVLAKKTVFGMGDTTVRILGTLPTKEISATAIFSATFPSGKHELSRNETHTSLGGNLNKVLRPAFVSGGLAWEHDWESNANGLGYTIGLGFFLNHALSVGGEVNGVIALNPKTGAVRDNQSMGFKVAYQTMPDFGIVVSTNTSMGTNTPQTSLGVTTYWRF